MPADLVPHAAIPTLAERVTPAMLEVLAYLQEAGFIQNSSELRPEIVEVLDQLASMGLVDPGYEGNVAQGRPHVWVRNGNGSRVLGYRTGIRSGPQYEIASGDLAAWLEEQGSDRWWNVDGDPLLTGRMTFPCPANRLAKELRRINRPLIVQARKDDSEARGQPAGKDRLDQVVAYVSRKRHQIGLGLLTPPPADRALRLCWTDSLFEWTLSEDSRTTALMTAVEGQTRETANVTRE
jgi:hypothetical protein